MSESGKIQAAAALRRFNRFYTRLLGLLNRQLLDSPLSLSEARILYEIAAAPGCVAAELAQVLGMDRGQLSRTLSRLMQQGLVARRGKPGGRKSLPLSLTSKGLGVLSHLEHAADKQAERILAPLDERGTARLQACLGEAQALLQNEIRPEQSVTLRTPASGDLGWIVMRHAEFYGHGHGFGPGFEGYVLLGLAEYLQRSNARSRIWIAQRGGEPLGSVAIVEQPGNQAQMRWLLVEPHARGLGVGKLLVRQAMDFAREQGFARVFLWTVSELLPARSLYSSLGFFVIETKEGDMGGRPVTEECWAMDLP